MTKKFVFDDSSQTRMRVVGEAHTWEQLGPHVRVRRRIVGPKGSDDVTAAEALGKKFNWDFFDLLADL